jgi:hypothetical protein
MARRLLIVLAALAALAGCGGGSGSSTEADKSAAQILVDAKQAAREAGSVSVTGSIDDNGTKIDLDLHIAKSTGTGSITIQGTKVDLIRIGQVVYLRAGADFYERIGAGKVASKLLAGRWLKASSTQKDFKNIAQLTDLDDFVTQAVKPEGTLTKGDETTVDGQKAIELKDSKGGTLLVATTGEPYPLVFKGGGSTSGTVTLSDWGEKVVAKAPAGAIDIGMLGRS